MAAPMPAPPILDLLQEGQVIPAHPLALTPRRTLDERRQRALTRYYCAAGAGGVAVGVHTTQFAIRDPKYGLFQPVIALAGETVDESSRALGRPIIKIGGLCGRTPQAVAEASLLAEAGFHVALVSLSALKDAGVDTLVDHCRAIAAIIPVMGFYLQPAVGGRLLPVAFWRRLAEIENVVAIKIAPFNRYQTFDVIRGVAESGRGDLIALYTGNDDNIVVDLLTTYHVQVGGRNMRLRIVGGLLGHWAFWTRRAVELLHDCHRIVEPGGTIPQGLLTRAMEITDANAAAFDTANGFAGCIAGIHEILVRQGLMAGRWTLDPAEDVSPGQVEEINRVYAAYPHLNDDAFVAEHLDEWLK
jgi:dihydrodipicolinate synthase/N-acetylneuraminate lyase